MWKNQEFGARFNFFWDFWSKRSQNYTYILNMWLVLFGIVWRRLLSLFNGKLGAELTKRNSQEVSWSPFLTTADCLFNNCMQVIGSFGTTFPEEDANCQSWLKENLYEWSGATQEPSRHRLSTSFTSPWTSGVPASKSTPLNSTKACKWPQGQRNKNQRNVL